MSKWLKSNPCKTWKYIGTRLWGVEYSCFVVQFGKKNYNGNNTIINWNEFHIHKLCFFYCHFGLFLCFPLHVFLQKKGWNLILWKDPHGKWVTNKNQIDCTNFRFLLLSPMLYDEYCKFIINYGQFCSIKVL